MGLATKKTTTDRAGLEYGFTFPLAYWDSVYSELFPKELQSLICSLHHEFEPLRKQLLEARIQGQKLFDQGQTPTYLSKDSEAVRGNWKVAPLPEILRTRRVEITGPAHSTKMVIQMEKG